MKTFREMVAERKRPQKYDCFSARKTAFKMHRDKETGKWREAPIKKAD